MFEFTDFTHANLEICAEAYAGLAPGPSRSLCRAGWGRLGETRESRLLGLKRILLRVFHPASRALLAR